MKVYISGALQASQNLLQARELYQAAAGVVAQLGAIPYVPHAKTDPRLHHSISAREVFLQDFRELSHSNAIVAFLNEPSLGVGAEVAMALQRGIPVLGLHHSTVTVSRFLAGLMSEANAPLRAYDGIAEIGREIASFYNSLSIGSRRMAIRA